jgi:hypothetical protein
MISRPTMNLLHGPVTGILSDIYVKQVCLDKLCGWFYMFFTQNSWSEHTVRKLHMFKSLIASVTTEYVYLFFYLLLLPYNCCIRLNIDNPLPDDGLLELLCNIVQQ